MSYLEDKIEENIKMLAGIAELKKHMGIAIEVLKDVYPSIENDTMRHKIGEFIVVLNALYPTNNRA